ncbi:hypothetical protein D3C76_895970 [compost metagenome]
MDIVISDLRSALPPLLNLTNISRASSCFMSWISVNRISFSTKILLYSLFRISLAYCLLSAGTLAIASSIAWSLVDPSWNFSFRILLISNCVGLSLPTFSLNLMSYFLLLYSSSSTVSLFLFSSINSFVTNPPPFCFLACFCRI